MKKIKNKKTLIILLILCIGVIGITIAYFSNSTILDNLFSTKEYGTTYTETFISPDNWLPGDTTDKTVVVTNSGQVDEAVRISYTESWISNSGTTLSGLIDENGKLTDEEENSEKAAIINFSNTDDWTYNNGYYYYNYKLAPSESTSSFIESVTFNPNVTLGDTCTETESNGVKTVTCSSSGDDYDNATYKLTLTIETVQYNKYMSAWNTDVAIENIKQKKMNVGQFLVTNKNEFGSEYNESTRTKMFEFKHEATEQTSALTDYRYIGNNPNNYIYFNCDNDGSNCEVWRIIGVFSVDDGNGNYEQRIKIVRGLALPVISNYSGLNWDSNGQNNWTTSSLNNFLNGDYLFRRGDAINYGLKALAQTQISAAKYYLGGAPIGSSDLYFGDAENIYDWERGNTVYLGNSLSLSTNIGLLYPSDFAYTYANGVNDICYDDITKCWNGGNPAGDPTTGWIFNSNISEINLSTSMIWLISSASDNSYNVFFTASNGWTVAHQSYRTNSYMDARPVLYLKPDVMIYSGDGSEENPYCLQKNCTKQRPQYYLGQRIVYDDDYYYIISDGGDYLTLLKRNPLTNDQINEYSNDYFSTNGEYPYLQNDGCNTSNKFNCNTNFNNSSIKKLLDSWANKYNNDLISVDGYKVRLVNDNDNFVDKQITPSSIIIKLNSNSPDYINSFDTYWSSIIPNDSNKKIFGIKYHNIEQLNVYDTAYVRPVINLRKCAIEGGCELNTNNTNNTSNTNNTNNDENNSIYNNYDYYIGNNVVYKNTNYCVIKDSTKTDDYITLIKSEPLTYDELVTHNNGYEIERNNQDNNVGVMHYYKGGTCESETNGSGCSSLTYDMSDVKNVVDNWSNTIINDLKEVDGYKARLITYNELSDIGYLRRLSGTQYVYYSDSDTECSTNTDKYWTEVGAVGMSLNTFMYFREYGAVRPVINLKKCAITNTCE